MASKAGVGVWGKGEHPESWFEAIFPLSCGKDVTEENCDMVIASDTPKWNKWCLFFLTHHFMVLLLMSVTWFPPEFCVCCNKLLNSAARVQCLTWHKWAPYSVVLGYCQHKEQYRWIADTFSSGWGLKEGFSCIFHSSQIQDTSGKFSLMKATQGWEERLRKLGLFGFDRFREDLTKVCKYLIGVGSKVGVVRFFPVVPSEKVRGNGHILQQQTGKELFHCEGDQALA